MESQQSPEDQSGISSTQSDPPSLEAMDGSSSSIPQPPDQLQQHSDDSQMDDAMQEVSSQSSSQMPELEQMEGGPGQIFAEEEDSQGAQSAPDMEAMEIGEVIPQQVVLTQEQIPAEVITEEAVPTSSTSGQVEIGVVEEQQIGAEQVEEMDAPAILETEEQPLTIQLTPVGQPPAIVVTQEEQPPAIVVTQEQSPAIVVTQEQPPDIVVTQEQPPAIVVTQEQSPAIVVTQEQPPDIVTQEQPPDIVVTQGEQPPAIVVTQEEQPPAIVVTQEEQSSEIASEHVLMESQDDQVEEMVQESVVVVQEATDVLATEQPGVDVSTTEQPERVTQEPDAGRGIPELVAQQPDIGEDIQVAQQQPEELATEPSAIAEVADKGDETEMAQPEQASQEEEAEGEEDVAEQVSEEKEKDPTPQATQETVESQEKTEMQEKLQAEEDLKKPDAEEIQEKPEAEEPEAAPQEEAKSEEADTSKDDTDKSKPDQQETSEDEPPQKKSKLDSNDEPKEQEKSETDTTKEQATRKPDTKIVLTLSPESAAKKGAAEKEAATKGGQREVVLSFNMQEMLAATDKDSSEKSPSKTVPMNVQVGTPKTRQAAKRTASKESPEDTKQNGAPAKSQDNAKSTRSASTPSKSDDSASTSVRRSSRRKSSTPKCRPKDLLESPSEDEDDEEEEEEEEEEEKEEAQAPVRRGRGRPKKSSATPVMPKKSTPSRGRGRPPKIKTEPLDKPIKIKKEPDPDWYGGKPKSTWTKKEERALVMYIVDWQKQAPDGDEEEESEEEMDDGKMTTKEFNEMHLMVPVAKNEKEWKECADFVSKSTQKPMRAAKACHEFALTIQECMTNEGAMEHYNLNETKVRQDFIRSSAKKPQRGKQAGSKTLWTDEEEQALVIFILFWQIKQKPKMIREKVASTRRSKKPTKAATADKEDAFRVMPVKSKLWDDCAKFISRKACLPKRTGAACRSYALGIQKKFGKQEAIEHYEIDSEYDSDAMEVPPVAKTSSAYDQYMQDDSFMFNLWLSEIGKLTSYQEEHVLHRLLLKKISRGDFKGNDLMFYFKHLPTEEQSEVADLITAEGCQEKENGDEGVDEETVAAKKSSKFGQYQAYAMEKKRSMDGFSRQMQVNLHQSEKQLKNMRETLNRLQTENKYLHDKVNSMKEVIGRVSSTSQSAPKRAAWSLDMDQELNFFRKKHLFQWLLLNGYIPRLPKDGIMIPKGLFYCIFSAIEELEDQGRPNSVFHFAKALCLCKTSGERIMPANRMPYALLEANIMFFGGKGYNFSQQEGYKRWVETQYAWFGEVWFSLFGGPNMKSMAGEEPKPLEGIDSEDVESNGRSENGSEQSEPPTKKKLNYEIRLQPEGFSPPADSSDYYKVGERWGKLVPLESPVPTSIVKNSSESAKQISTRKSPRQAAKPATEIEDDVAKEETSPPTPSTPPPKASTSKQFKTPTSVGRRRGVKQETSEYAVDDKDIDKFIKEHSGELPEGPDLWANPPDFSFEDDFIVPENSDLNKVRLNVISGSPRTIQRRHSPRELIIQPGATIKVELLQQLQRINPSARWWIKTGWCDITLNKSLRITSKQEFTGDEDLGDGSVQEHQELYKERLQKTRAIGVAPRKTEAALREDLFRQIADLQDDNAQLCEGLRKVRVTRGIYKSKMGVPERAAVDEAVDREISTYVKLLEKNQDLRVRVERALSQGSKARVIALRNDLAEYLTQFTIRMRVIANYVLIFMISDEKQTTNPHSWPVRISPVHSLSRELIETLRDQLIEAMATQGLEIVGIIRDELTPHLAVGTPERAVCITQLIDEARSEVSTFHPSEMEKYFTIVTLFSRSGDLRLTPQWRHTAVPVEDVIWVYNYMNEKKATFLQALQALHTTLFPEGYTPHPFRQLSKVHTLESQILEDQLRALMAIYIFRHKIKTYAAEGVDFDNYLYAPTIHPLTKQPLHVRDSVTKLLRSISRQAKDDDSLTTDKRDRLSNALDCWFKAAINTWWTPSMRHDGNQALLDFVLEDWMPFEVEDRKYSAIDVNRPVSNVSFLSEDLLVSLIVNVESENQRPALHPWAATCQDVNMFVHLIKNPGQRQNDARQIMHPQILKKLCVEFYKAIDPDLEFYYYWGDHEKTLYNILLNLNDPRTKRSATSPKYRKKKPKVVIKEEKQDGAIVEVEEHSQDATEEDEDEDQMEISTNADEEGTSSGIQQQVHQAVDMSPIPISVTAANLDDLTEPPQATVVTVTAPAPTTSTSQVIVTAEEGTAVVQNASTEDIIAAELLRQIEASLQAGVAVVTVTEGQQQPDTAGQSQADAVQSDAAQPDAGQSEDK